MNNIKYKSTLHVITLFLMMIAHLSYATQDTQYSLDRFHYEKEINPQWTLFIDNPYGDVRIRSAPNDTLVIHAVYQKIGENPLIPEMKQYQNNSEIHFDFTYPEDSIPERLQDGRIDVAVIVPENMLMDIHIERGTLRAKGLNNAIKAYSDASNMLLKTSGNIDVYTRTGDINLHLPKNTVSHSKLTTSNGNIDVSFLENSIAFDVTTTASISSNDINLLKSRVVNKHHQILTIGNPVQKMTIRSDAGQVRLINRNDIHP